MSATDYVLWFAAWGQSRVCVAYAAYLVEKINVYTKINLSGKCICVGSGGFFFSFNSDYAVERVKVREVIDVLHKLNFNGERKTTVANA